MKKTDKVASMVVGFILFAIAAVFSIGLLLQLLDFDMQNSGQHGGLYRLGELLASVYGFCSILIPVFFITAGSFCFSDNWSVQKGVCLLMSIVPFFTAAVAERMCRNILYADEGPLAAIKIVTIIVIAALMVVAEYLVTLVITGLCAKKKNTAKEDDVPQKEQADEQNKTTEGLTFKSILSPEHKAKETPETDDEAIEKAVDKSISEVTSANWTLDELLRKSKDNEVAAAPAEKKLSTDSKYGKYDSANYVKEATLVDINKDGIPDIEQDLSTPVEVDDASTADDLADINELMEKASVVESNADETAQDEDDAENDANLPDEDDILSLDEAASDESDNADDAAEMEPVQPETQSDEAKNVKADPWNVTGDNQQGQRVVYLGKMVKPSRKNPTVPQNNGDIPQDEVDLEDPAGLVEKKDTAMQPAQDDTPQTEGKTSEDEMSAEEKLTQNFSGLMDDGSTASDETEPDNDSKGTAASGTDKTPPNFGKGSGIEEEPENSNTAPAGHSMFSILDNVFAKMDKDAKAQIEAEDNSVEANNSASSKQIDENIKTHADSAVAAIANDVVANAAAKTEKDSVMQIIPRAVPKRIKHGVYKIPTELLTAYADNPYWIIDNQTNVAAQNIKETLNEFRIEAEVTGIRKGPVVTMFEMLPAPGVKLSKVVALQDNIALRLAASSVRIVAPIPGKRAVGIEVPNKDRAIVSFRECIEQNLPEWKKMAVPVVLGKDIQGETQIIDLVKTPHLLIAGSTGSGKSVCVNSMILSILYKRSPDEVKMILIDPKIVELKLYNDIPHLLTPVITEPKRAMQALQYCLCEMERRYALLDGLGVRDIANYNKRIQERKICTEKLPYIVVIIDEFADLMATTGKELEGVVARLAAMSRAVGIHLVLATQRPSIDVITGLIKANIPSRIAFMVASKTDSRIIIDQVGAEKLLGKGDMLYSSSTDPFPVRIQGTFVSDTEVEDVVESVKQWGEPEYIDDEIFVDDDEEGQGEQMSLFSDGEDPLYEKALDIVVQAGKASASYIQRRLKIGYNRAARLVEEMEDRGIVGPANGSKPREIIHMP